MSGTVHRVSRVVRVFIPDGRNGRDVCVVELRDVERGVVGAALEALCNNLLATGACKEETLAGVILLQLAIHILDRNPDGVVAGGCHVD
jgi:hypothetical protein